jgi:hypothetical protein
VTHGEYEDLYLSLISLEVSLDRREDDPGPSSSYFITYQSLIDFELNTAENPCSLDISISMRRLDISPLITYVCARTLLPTINQEQVMAHLLEDTYRLINQILVSLIRSITTCIDNRKRPGSPTISAQEGELDNLLTEHSGGWDDLPASRGYYKALNMTVDSNDNGGTAQVQPSRLPATWIEGRTMEELSREEEELARFDPPGPPRDVEAFGDFEQAPGTGPL